jgi:hypothetical protein
MGPVVEFLHLDSECHDATDFLKLQLAYVTAAGTHDACAGVYINMLFQVFTYYCHKLYHPQFGTTYAAGKDKSDNLKRWSYLLATSS